jgi:RNA polymerase sigma-70 factor (ECF subfamily)
VRPDHPRDERLLDRLREGDEQAFVTLVQRYRASMLRIAAAYVPGQAVAEEVVQDTWLAVLRGVGTFEGRSSVRTWLFRILVNRARTTGARERRSVALGDDLEPVVDQARFDPTGQWSVPPAHWRDQVDDRLAADAMVGRIRTAILDLPARQREVVTLRDIEGLSSDEVCSVLELTEANQRVLLHRGRSRLRQLLEAEFGRA